MVYVPSSKYEDAYQRIVAGASHSSGTSVVIFASTADGDTLCGLRILTGLLKRDAIGHKIVPISSYADIVQMNAKLVAANAQIRTLVFLNCGATVDIQDYVTLRDSLTVVIVDSHRPFNLYNVYWNDQVQCLDDGEVEESMAEMQKAFEEIEFGDDDGDGEDDSEGGDGGGSGSDGESPGRRRRLNSASDRDSASDGDDSAQPQPRRRNPRPSTDPDEFIRLQRLRAERRQARSAHQQRIQAYYAQGAYHGQACAVSMQRLAEQLGHPASLDSVWCAITGAATQHLLQHADGAAHALTTARLRDLVRRVSGPAAPGGAADATPKAFTPQLELPHADDDEGYARARSGAGSAAEAGLLASTARQAGPRTAIAESSELKLALLRHWSLDSAMRFSPYVATRLGTWSSRGRARLDLLLAKLGLSKAEARAPFQHLAPELKLQLHRRMAEIGADYAMADAVAPGFVRDYGWRKPSVSGTDMALALLALLQDDGFYAAYDALADIDALRRGLLLAQAVQMRVVALGLGMLERQAVKALRAFRLAVVAEADAAHLSPPVLRQLALFLMHTLREQHLGAESTARKRAARLPFVIAAPVSAELPDRMLVLGITAPDYAPRNSLAGAAKYGAGSGGSGGSAGSAWAGGGRAARNHFGLVFDEVAQDLGADVRQGFFDSSVLEIARSDMSVFVDKLRKHL